ncbi:hypothetical protein B0H65DRAFT_592097 [Neurospora tetraspora]|uniref:Secreted protein n=1 Tax=Neurospora tetraspora TaxID=94610 RepID=A0AAE0J7R1_9PEZI|nr:hypothetical protein B0H65DRAFT_592097 [Neurospora tetraspora]
MRAWQGSLSLLSCWTLRSLLIFAALLNSKRKRSTCHSMCFKTVVDSMQVPLRFAALPAPRAHKWCKLPGRCWYTIANPVDP